MNSFSNHPRLSRFALLVLLAMVSPAVFAHGSERGLVMLLPTGYYLAGGALSVAASFVLLALVPAHWLGDGAWRSRPLVTLHRIAPMWPSLGSLAVLFALLYAGYYGSRDPLANPMPLTVWTLWWVGFMALQFIAGELWSHLNPWSGLIALCRHLLPGLRTPRFRLPERIGYLPAMVVFLGFVWFELVDLAPDDPQRLATVALAYWLYAFFGIALFGESAWFARAEPFAIFFRLIGACSPFVRVPADSGPDGQRVHLCLTWPGAQLLHRPALPLSGVLFVLLTLGSVSVDGFLKTFTWLAFIDVNPLEFPGRSAVQVANSLGLIAGWATLCIVFFLAVYLGCVFAGRTDLFKAAAGRLIFSIVPISLVFHLAHYLTALLINGQYAVVAVSDPFAMGWNLFGTKYLHVTTSMLTHHESVAVLWSVQTVAITTGHILGILVAHLTALALFRRARAVVISQSVLAGLMVLYTLFGLWLLSTPTVA